MSQRVHSDQTGFTILELLIATMVFSVIFLGATTALIQISKLYYKGVVTGHTQEAARSITDEISQKLQFDSGNFVVGAPTDHTFGAVTLHYKAFCVGTTRYSYATDVQVDSNQPNGSYTKPKLAHALWRDTVADGSCPAPANLDQAKPSADPNGQELLGQNMRLLNDFGVSCVSNTNSNSTCAVTVGIIYGDDDLLAYNSNGIAQCQTIIGDQWCAASQFTTSVLRRVTK